MKSAGIINEEVGKPVSFSLTQVSHVVLSDDANPLGILRGGRLLEWMDMASEITAQKHAHYVAVTAKILEVSFNKSIRIGDIVTIRAQITRAFTSSMEIYVQVWAEHVPDLRKTKTNEAFFTLVAIDNSGHPVKVPGVEPRTEFEFALFESALDRKKSTISTINPNRYDRGYT